ncbi:unnamed protein product [Ambrosiozyma monospora]|uniref:Unnamed protein product n=1 Tax=Ambrosiozyma monospora TaxID=43982 RepID=A0ACB5TDN4_AMBMO|nr:unnamed protein product [Ambrosiozyma monospora]
MNPTIPLVTIPVKRFSVGDRMGSEDEDDVGIALSVCVDVDNGGDNDVLDCCDGVLDLYFITAILLRIMFNEVKYMALPKEVLIALGTVPLHS